MLLTYLMLSVALCLSAVAAFYSIVGLTAIFAAAVIPVIIMGSILEIAKLVITVWLHEFWTQVKLTMKIYLIPAVITLMFITSMGIFGFLSKAHIEQVGVGQENAAQLQRITVEIQRQTDIVKAAETRAKTLETNGTGADANVQSQINQEQQRIDSSYTRIQPAIDDQQRIIDAQTKIYQDQITKIDEQLAQLQKYMDSKEVERVQTLVGVKPDGDWGPGTARAVTTWKNLRVTERTAAVSKLEEANTNPTIKSARDEILRIRKTVETQISESNRLIDRLRNQLGKGDTASVETLVTEQQEKIRTSNLEIEKLTQKKYELEAEYRKLEVEVGPIKYIAELVYGDSTDKNTLEHAVRWVIILIVAVFDPLAVMMLLAASESIVWIRQRLSKPKTTSLDVKSNNDDLINKRLTEMTDELNHENSRLHSEIDNITEQFNKTLSERNKLFTAHSYEMERADDLAVKLSEVEEQQREQLANLLSETLKKIDVTNKLNDYEMERADTLAVKLEEVESRTRKTLDELLDETPEVIKGTEVETLPTVIDEPIIEIPSEIKTEGVTSAKIIYQEMNGYVTFDGKLMSVEALKTLRPDLILSSNNTITQIMFGTKFPQFAKIGDIYIRTDIVPHLVFKFNGKKWIGIDKKFNNSYIQYVPYIKYLIQKIESGEYDAELLTDNERDEIATHLESK